MRAPLRTEYRGRTNREGNQVFPRAQAVCLLSARTSSDWLLDDATSMTAVHACEPSYSSSLWILRTRRVHHRKKFVRMPIMALRWTGKRAGINFKKGQS
jgi:hypothetical protein